MASESLKTLERWAEHAADQLNTITVRLQEMECLLEKLDDEDINLMDFLKSIDYIQQKHNQIVTKALSSKVEIDDMKNEIEIQMKILESLLQLMEIESGNS